jgi:hypothetical protein
VRSPIVVDGRWELLFFKTPADAAAYAEEVDIKNQEYGDFWDADGTLLRWTIEERKEKIFRIFNWRYRRPVLREESAPAERAEELRTALVGFLEKQGAVAQQLQGKGLRELVDLGVAHCGWT